jgi:hypothetical protein
MNDGRSMRAVKNNLPTPSGEVEESEGPRWTRAIQGATQAPFRRGCGKTGKGSGEAGQNDRRKKKGKKRARLSRIQRLPSFQKKVQSCFTDSISQYSCLSPFCPRSIKTVADTFSSPR